MTYRYEYHKTRIFDTLVFAVQRIQHLIGPACYSMWNFIVTHVTTAKCSLSTYADYYNTYTIMILSRPFLGDLLFTRANTHHRNINIMYLYRAWYTVWYIIYYVPMMRMLYVMRNFL